MRVIDHVLEMLLETIIVWTKIETILVLTGAKELCKWNVLRGIVGEKSKVH
jgi:hypothetical protein